MRALASVLLISAIAVAAVPASADGRSPINNIGADVMLSRIINPPARSAILGPTASPQDFDALCNGLNPTHDCYSAIVSAKQYIDGMGVGQVLIPDGTIFSGTGIDFGATKVRGAVAIMPGITPSGPTIECATTVTTCVTAGVAGTTTAGTDIENVNVTFEGTPQTGQQAFLFQGVNGTASWLEAYNTYDAFTFANGLQLFSSHLYTHQVTHMHVVQNGAPGWHISISRFGVNGNDAANSEAFIGVTGNNPNTLIITNSQFNLGSQSPSHLIEYYNVTNEVDGIISISHSMVDMSVGNCTSLVKTDSTSFVYRLVIEDTPINASACSTFLDQSAQSQAPADLKLLNNSFITAPISLDTGAVTGLSFDIRGNLLNGAVTLNSGTGHGIGVFSQNTTTAPVTITSTGASWGSLTALGNIPTSTWTDNAATGSIYYSGKGTTFTVGVLYGATTATATTSGVASRQPDGSVVTRIGAQITNLNGGTGAVTITGAPYSCQSWGLGPAAIAPVLANSGFAGLTGAPMATMKQNGTLISLYQTSATGLAALTDANIPVNAIFSLTLRCPAQ